ncbi:MAG TPA: DUF5658 family protein [Phycisphaerae bacterium]|nr:hypothetical protein [Phycisphaerales bacterium]HRX84541.1 DUF5658 family protein [Phycisphaerae bacterium]
MLHTKPPADMLTTTPALPDLKGGGAPRTWRTWPVWELVAARDGRVLAMLAVIWVLSFFDYVHTVHGVRTGLVEECNPLAVWFVGHGPLALLAFKGTLVVTASAGMFHCRRHPLTEIMLAVVLIVLVLVMLRWSAAYALYEYSVRLAPPGYNLP